ncbi:MAG: hypothetical protein KF912_15115 [Phycisphaeraceae bacterium]|nr:hypothetical protein [Phycisphaeraceae bacterium]MBX3368637.1 hypothetical protein [Phycisphaeraceae bacterium]
MFRTMCVGLVAASVASGASAQIVGFVEDFNTDAAAWRNFNSASILEWVPAGGPDGTAFARSTYNLVAASGMFPPIVIRAQSSFVPPSSNAEYVGNWIEAGVTGVSFSFRHDLPVPISLTGRFATPNNMLGAATETSYTVEPNVWTTISYDLTEGSSDIISFGAGSYLSIFSNIGNIQLGFNVPAGYAGQNLNVNFDVDNFTIVPAPGALALLGVAGLVARRRR